MALNSSRTRPSRIERNRDEIAARRARILAATGEHSNSTREASSAQAATPARSDGATPNLSAIWLRIEQLQLNPIYGRSISDETVQKELNASVAEHGILEPVLVRQLTRPKGGKTHELVAGYRRVQAAQSNGQQTVPAIERTMSDVEAAQISVSENLQRQNPHPGDIGLALTNLKEQMQRAIDAASESEKEAWMETISTRATQSKRQPRVTWEDVGERVHLSKRTLLYYIDIAKLPPDVLEQTAPTNKPTKGKLSARQARAIAGVQGENAQRELAQRALQEGLTGDQIEAQTAQTRRKNITSEKKNKSASPTDNRPVQVLVEQSSAALQVLAQDAQRGNKTGALSSIAQNLENSAEIPPAQTEIIAREIAKIRQMHAAEATALARIEAAIREKSKDSITKPTS